MSISSDEVNLLIQHYLQELNYDHTSFSFGCESKIPTNPIANREIPPGSLVYLIQKGVMYAQIESAAEEASTQPEIHFNHQLNLLKNSIKQNSEFSEKILEATKRIKVFPTNDQNEPNKFYLSEQSSLFLEGHSSSVLLTSWSHNSKYLASISTDGSIVIWEFNEDYVNDNPIILKPNFENNNFVDITSICWSPNDEYLIIGTYTGLIFIYQNQKEFLKINQFNSSIITINFNNSGQIFAIGCQDGTISMFKDFKLFFNYKFKCEQLSDIYWLNEDTIILSIDSKIFKIKENNEPELIYDNQILINHLIYFNNNLIFGDNNGKVFIFENDFKKPKLDHQQSDPIITVSNSYNNKFIASGSISGFLYLKSKTDLIEFSTDFPIINILFDPKNKYFISINSSDILNLYSQKNKKLLVSFYSPYQINHISWSNDGKFIVVSLQNGQLSIIDINNLC